LHIKYSFRVLSRTFIKELTSFQHQWEVKSRLDVAEAAICHS